MAQNYLWSSVFVLGSCIVAKRKVLISAILFIVVFSCGAQSGQVTDGHTLVGKAASEIININTDELLLISERASPPIYIDVRTPAEIDQQGGTIDLPRLYNVERGWLEYKVPERVRDKDHPIVVFCDTNQRSPLATAALMKMGYTNVKNYSDGFLGWKSKGLPLEGDNAPISMLYRLPQKVVPQVWSAIGFTGPGDYFNSGHNNNLTFIITDEGVVVVNAGENYLLAKALHNEIKNLTDQQVKYVILENGQGHAMLGSSYWQEQGAQVVAHVDAASEIQEKGAQILNDLFDTRRDKLAGTKLSEPDITFQSEFVVTLGGVRIEALHLGPTHSPGDIVVWLPTKKLVISGDVAFHQRMLPIFEYTDTDGWIDTWSAFLALGAEIVIPGHGGPTDYDKVTKYTRDYLQYMRDEVGEIIDNGGELQDAYGIDQTKYSYLDTYFELARQNSGRIFREMEFE